MSRAVVADLRYELTGLVARLARLGIIADTNLDDLAETITRDLYDQEQARATAYAVMGVLWPTGWPELVGRPGWWSQEPLGVVCAHILGAVEDDRETVSHQVAADMLQVTRGTIATMVSRGTIASVPGQGVLRTAVLTRIGRGMPAWEPPPTTVTVTVEPGITEPGITFTRQGVTYWRFFAAERGPKTYWQHD